MASQSRILAELEVTNGNASHIRISIVYRIGGINYFTSENQKRGLYIDVTPITKSEIDMARAWGFHKTKVIQIGECPFCEEPLVV